MKKKICILGLGYIGLPTAAMFAANGHPVVGVDVKEEVVDLLNNGEVSIEEPGLATLINNVVSQGMLKADVKPCEADAFIISVPTPINDDKTANMQYVSKATKAIVPYVKTGNIVILESTSPPQTVETLMLPILAESGLNVGEDLLVAHSPERVLPGKILHELIYNDRIVGGINEKSSIAVKELYESFVKGNIYITDATTAEMCKLMENTFRDVNIALANELAKICDELGINAWDVIKLSNRHPRVNLHQPGPGVGGHCIAVDPWFIVERIPSLSKIIQLSRNINDSMPCYVVNKILLLLKDVEKNKKVTVLGITYKPDVDDIRESPILEIIKQLKKNNIAVSIVDPHVVNNDKISTVDITTGVTDSDLILLGVNHCEFADLDFNNIKKIMASPNILDTRNFWADKKLTDLGFNYFVLGKGMGVS